MSRWTPASAILEADEDELGSSSARRRGASASCDAANYHQERLGLPHAQTDRLPYTMDDVRSQLALKAVRTAWPPSRPRRLDSVALTWLGGAVRGGSSGHPLPTSVGVYRSTDPLLVFRACRAAASHSATRSVSSSSSQGTRRPQRTSRKATTRLLYSSVRRPRHEVGDSDREPGVPGRSVDEDVLDLELDSFVTNRSRPSAFVSPVGGVRRGPSRPADIVAQSCRPETRSSTSGAAMSGRPGSPAFSRAMPCRTSARTGLAHHRLRSRSVLLTGTIILVERIVSAGWCGTRHRIVTAMTSCSASGATTARVAGDHQRRRRPPGRCTTSSPAEADLAKAIHHRIGRRLGAVVGAVGRLAAGSADTMRTFFDRPPRSRAERQLIEQSVPSKSSPPRSPAPSAYLGTRPQVFTGSIPTISGSFAARGIQRAPMARRDGRRHP